MFMINVSYCGGKVRGSGLQLKTQANLTNRHCSGVRYNPKPSILGKALSSSELLWADNDDEE